MNIVLPGRYLIFTPMEGENRVSQRIRDKKLRTQLMKMLDSMGTCHGCILRSAAAGAQTDVLVREAKILTETWRQVQKHFEGDQSALIMLGPDAIQRALSDHADRRIDRIELTTMDHFQLAEEWCDVYAPDLVTKVRPVELADPHQGLGLFELRDIISQIEGLFHPYVLLPGGGSVIIDTAAAGTLVDVNAGADRRGHLTVNLEAAHEIARQLRLRNMGGGVLIDFLKMKTAAERAKVEKALGGFFMEGDPCTVQIHGFTRLGFLEMTRQRRTPPLQERFESVIGNS